LEGGFTFRDSTSKPWQVNTYQGFFMELNIMSSRTKRYLTTPIYYASGSPHLGHAYTTFIADCYKRYYVARGDEVLLASGTDEHGQKIEQTSARHDESVELFVEKRSLEFSNLWESLQIDLDVFERTSSAQHKTLVIEFWQRLRESGDIYKGHYEGLYCIECEQYFTEGDHCPVHRKPLAHYSEESYFFRLSAYQQKLIDHIESHPGFIVPDSRRNEVLSFLKGTKLHDLSISRTSTSWGIQVPDDPRHVIYVWVDALATYLSAIGPLGSRKFEEYWPNTTHFIGKDILIFHAVYWPALLWSAGLDVPQHLIVNGWLTVEGRKISKSDPETIIDPSVLVDLAGCDGLKYYFLKAVKLGQDLDFQQDHLIALVNSDLANNFGNLFSRFIKLFAKHFPNGVEVNATQLTSANLELLSKVSANEIACTSYIENFSPTAAGRTFVETGALLNADFQQREPWKILDRTELAEYLWTLHKCLAGLTRIGACLVPDIARKARDGLCLQDAQDIKGRLTGESCVNVREIESLFPRL
jgi:methionyl-tRNA synthetase